MIGWTAPPRPHQLLLLVLGSALLVFLIVLFTMKYMPLRMALTPGATKTRRVRRRAIMLFKAAAERRTVGRTGILIYLSMGEHRAEIVGDEAITAVTTPETWGEAMAALLTDVKAGRPADGIVAAIGLIGARAGEHFPQDGHRHQRNPRQADRALSRHAANPLGGQVSPHRSEREAGNMSNGSAG